MKCKNDFFYYLFHFIKNSNKIKIKSIYIMARTRRRRKSRSKRSKRNYTKKVKRKRRTRRRRRVKRGGS